MWKRNERQRVETEGSAKTAAGQPGAERERERRVLPASCGQSIDQAERSVRALVVRCCCCSSHHSICILPSQTATVTGTVHTLPGAVWNRFQLHIVLFKNKTGVAPCQQCCKLFMASMTLRPRPWRQLCAARELLWCRAAESVWKRCTAVSMARAEESGRGACVPRVPTLRVPRGAAQ